MLSWALAACSRTPEATPEIARAAPERTEPTETVRPLPERALAYSATEHPTDRRIARAQESVRTHPESVEALDTLAALFSRRYRETGDSEYLRLSEDALRAALERDSEDALALSLSGLLEMSAHRFESARDIAHRILRRDRQDTTALLLLGDAQLELGEYDAAEEAYQRATDLRPDLRTYNRGAYLRWLHGDVEGALELLRLADDAGSMRDPESTAWCLVDLASVHWHRGDRARVRAALEQALSLVQGYAPALRLRARLDAAEGRAQGAIQALEALLQRQESVGDHLVLSELLEQAGRVDEAHAHVARAAEIGREDARALATYRARRGLDVEAALVDAEREVSRRHDVYSLSTYAMALARSARHAEARAAMDRALALGTPDVSLALADALVRCLAGDVDGARASLERARANPEVDRWLFVHVAALLGDAA